MFVKPLTFILGVTLAAGAMAADKTLGERHGGMWPASPDGTVTKYQCLKCHVSQEDLAKKTSALEPNPHWSHLGNVNCEECHKANKAKPELMCNTCHKFDYSRKN